MLTILGRRCTRLDGLTLGLFRCWPFLVRDVTGVSSVSLVLLTTRRSSLLSCRRVRLIKGSSSSLSLTAQPPLPGPPLLGPPLLAPPLPRTPLPRIASR